MQINSPVTAIILAGGKSSRMKSDKGFRLLQGKPLVEHVLEKAGSIVDDVLIIANDPAYEVFGVPCHPDLVKDCGPMGGIYTGLMKTRTQKNLVLSCDTPFIHENLMRILIEISGEEDVLLPEHNGQIEPLCAVYDVRCRKHFRSHLENKMYKIQDALRELNCLKINFPGSVLDMQRMFMNINTPEELDSAKQISE
jgi:molybdenum cofactor guanylyltransferase